MGVRAGRSDVGDAGAQAGRAEAEGERVAAGGRHEVGHRLRPEGGTGRDRLG